MKASRDQHARSARRQRESLFLLLLILLLVAWVEVVLRASPQPVPPGEGATWSTLVDRLYGRALGELNAYLAREKGVRAAVQRIVVLPIAGPMLQRYNAASPSAGGLLRHLQDVGQLDGLEAGWLRNHSGLARHPREGELGLRLRFNELTVQGDRVAAAFAVEIERPGQAPVLLAPDIRYEGSGVSLPWFIAPRGGWLLRLALGALSLALLGAGGWLGYVYYRLVEGRYVGPAAWARVINRVRAATGLIASSLLFLAGFLLLVLTFLLAPATGQAQGVRRVHVDLLVDGDEFMQPVSAFQQPTNALAGAVAQLGARVMGLLEMNDAGEIDEGRLGWLRHQLPTVLRTAETKLRINRGASWRIFAASEGQTIAADAELRWPEAEPALRKRAVLDALEGLARKMPERGFGLPLPWQTNGLPPLDPATRAALGQTGSAAEGPGQLATLVISAFQAPSRGYLLDWMAACSNRPPGDRVYGVLLPGLARSANREWESFEGRLLAAQALCDRVAVAQREPPRWSTNDTALAALAKLARRPLQPDVTIPLFPYDGLGLAWFRNAAVPADLTRDASILFAADRVQTGAVERLALDFRTWLLAGRDPVNQTLVFTIPRQATYLLVLALGLVFVVAGIRTEQNALGVPAWLPPLATLMSALVLPAFAGLWIHARHDTTRFVVFGFADLAFWGVLFLWLCVGVIPLFLGRARSGLPRNPWLLVMLAAALALMAVAPLLHGAARTRTAQVALAAVLGLAGLTLLLSLLLRRGGGSLRVTLLLFLGSAWGYLRFWGWAGQDLSAIGLLCVFLVMVASGWRHGLSWWQVTRHVEYDHIPWLRPTQRLLLALLLTLSGAATLFCSFPALRAAGLIRGYASYSVTLSILPYLLCALIVVLVDVLERDTR